MTYRVGLAIEQALGHITHHKNLEHWIATDKQVKPVWFPIPYRANDFLSRVPIVRSNHSLLLSLRARKAIKQALRQQSLDALFLHTQVTSLFSLGLMRRIPTVISLDATPINMDSVASGYNHRPASQDRLGGIKYRWNRAAFRRAAALTTWNQWAKDSLVRDYGIEDSKVTVIPPGVDMTSFRPASERRALGAINLLFVGGSFSRKGGNVLLDAIKDLSGAYELDIVTRDQAIESSGNIRVHRNIQPNSNALRQLYQKADIFVLPTMGDCMPLAIMEAMACGLPVIATRVGAIHEEVVDGETGILVPPTDAGELRSALQRLTDDEGLRKRFSAAARARAEEHFSAERNYRTLIALLKSACEQKRTQLSGVVSSADQDSVSPSQVDTMLRR